MCTAGPCATRYVTFAVEVDPTRPVLVDKYLDRVYKLDVDALCDKEGNGVICGIIGNIQATEAIKLILGKGRPLLGRLLRFNALEMTFREHAIPRDPGCPLCGHNPTITQLKEIEMSCTTDDITVEELKQMLDRKDDFLLVDVRNPDEFAVCKITGSKKLPLPKFPDQFNELPKDKLVVLHCHHGGRSMRALQFLRAQGYTKLKNVAGGISAWAERIDTNLPQY